MKDQREDHVNAISYTIDDMEDQNYEAYLQRVQKLQSSGLNKQRRITKDYYMNDKLWKQLKEY